MSLFHNAYHNKKVLVTGNTGFKGSWITVWLLELGAEVYGISDQIPTRPSHFEAAHLSKKIEYFELDICHLERVQKTIQKIQPDFLFHLAAQPLVRLSYEDPVTTLNTNIIGTANILEALRVSNHPCNAVMITSDKCYDNVEWTWGYRETDALGGKDPYSASKGAAELVIKTYVYSYFSNPQSNIRVAVGRAGNVIGGGDWAQDRVVPDCITAWSQGDVGEIRNPVSTRPWQHVLEPLSGYLTLGQQLAENSKLNGAPFNFGPSSNQNFTVAQLIDEMQHYWPNAQWKDVSTPDNVHEANLLKLCCDKALHLLNWMPTLDFQETVRLTVEWYRHYYQHTNHDIFPFTRQQITEYTETAIRRGAKWTK